MIVGVVKDSRHTSPRDPVLKTLFRSTTQASTAFGAPTEFAFFVRTSLPPEAAMNEIRRTIHERDPKLVVDKLKTMNAQIGETLTTERVMAMLASSFGVIATLLAGIGLYGYSHMSRLSARGRSESVWRRAQSPDWWFVRCFC